MPDRPDGKEDILGRALAEVGFTRADLGRRAVGYWSRFPLDIPYRLPAFDDLSAEPLRLYDVSTLMGNAVERYLKPVYADSAADGLYRLLYALDRRRGGFRSYPANLKPAPGDERPFAAAVEALYRLDGRETATMAFGEYSDSKVRETIEAAVAERTASSTWRGVRCRSSSAGHGGARRVRGANPHADARCGVDPGRGPAGGGGTGCRQSPAGRTTSWRESTGDRDEDVL